MANSINVGSLTKYVDQLSSALIREAVLRGKTVDQISIQSGVKYASALNIMSSALTAVAGATCGAITPAGTVTLSQRDITVCPLKVEEAICLNTLEEYWIGQFMKNAKGSYQDEMASGLAEAYAADKVAKLQALVEDLMWAGNTDTGSGNLALCDGFIKLFTDTPGVIAPYTSPSAPALLTSSNAIAQVEAIITLIPADVLDANDLTMFMSYANFRTLVFALRAANNFYADFATDKNWEFTYPGTNIKVVATRGLNSVNGGKSIIVTPASNLYLGTDMMSDTEQFKVWFDQTDDTVYFRAKWKQGVQVGYPQYVINYVGDVI